MNRSFFSALRGKHRPSSPVDPVLDMLDQLQGGQHPDYCLYLRSAVGGQIMKTSALSVDLEELLAKAFAPLPMLVLDESSKSPADAGLPDESFLMLANRARVLFVVPATDARFLRRLRILKTIGPIGRCIFVMPEQGTLGTVDWPSTIWPAICEAVAKCGITFSGYTAGGWLFRLDADGKSCTFRPIVNPNAEKIAKALEAICVEMNGS